MPVALTGFSLVDFPRHRLTVGADGVTEKERPPHVVELDAFALGDRCVSAADFAAFLQDSPDGVDHTMVDCIDPAFVVHTAAGFELRPGCGDFPMIQVSWWGAAAYCSWLSRAEGLRPVYDVAARSVDLTADGYRLPTESEWEAACRVGYPDGTVPGPDDCNSADAGPRCRELRASRTAAGAFPPGHPSPVPVASLPADAAGLHEMLGNLREWCHDRYGPYGGGAERNPIGRERGSFRVVRGGSFIDAAAGLGPAARMSAYENTRCEIYGFRVARRR